MFLPQPNYFNFGQTKLEGQRKLARQRCAKKFYGQSFHQQYHLAMHAKQ